MRAHPGFRVRVFGWPETWRVAPAPDGAAWRFEIRLAPGSPGRAVPPFLSRTEWSAIRLLDGLASIKAEIRERAGRASRRVFLVDEEPEDVEG
jgi:hypothetical protein